MFLIDEADKFIRHELQNDYQILDAMRAMSEEGHCQFIIAGFWRLYEQAVLDYLSPLKNFAEILELGELEQDACRALATEPMQTMNLSYESPVLVEQLLIETGRRANLMTITCHELLGSLQPNQRLITAANVTQALNSDKSFKALEGWDAMTDNHEARQLDRIVVFATIQQQYFDLPWLVKVLNTHGLIVDGQQLDSTLARLTLGFVLGRAFDGDKDGQYFFRVPLFRQMIQRDSPEVKLQLALEGWLGSH